MNNTIAELKRAADFGSQFVFEEGVYWRDGYPYCPACWDSNRKPIRLGGPTRHPLDMARDIWICPEHSKTQYMIHRNYKPRSPGSQ